MYERVIGPRGAKAERIVVLDDPVLAESLDGRTDQLQLFVLQRPRVVILLGAQPHSGLQGDESILGVLSPKQKRLRDVAERSLFAEFNQTIAAKLGSHREVLIANDNEDPKVTRRARITRIDKALAVIDPSQIDAKGQGDFWRTAFWAKDLYTSGRSIQNFEDATSLAALAAKMRVMNPKTLQHAANEWWVHGGDFATWVMDSTRPDLARQAFIEFRGQKSWQIFNAEMTALGDPSQALTTFPGSRVASYWKNGAHDFKKDPLYEDIVWPLRYEAFGDWVKGRPEEHFNNWSSNPSSEQPVNRLLRTIFFHDIKPIYIEGADQAVIADDQTRVRFLTQGVTDRGFPGNIESAVLDKLSSLPRIINTEAFDPIFRTAVDLRLAYPEANFRLLESDRFLNTYLQSLNSLQDVLTMESSGMSQQLELYAGLLAGGKLLGIGGESVGGIQPELLARMIRLRNKYNMVTNMNPLTDLLVRLGELQANIIILGSGSATSTSEGVVIKDSQARDIFNKDNWVSITPPGRIAAIA